MSKIEGVWRAEFLMVFGKLFLQRSALRLDFFSTRKLRQCGQNLTLYILTAVVLAAPILGKGSYDAPRPPKASYELTIDGTATMKGPWLCGGDAQVQTIPAGLVPLDPSGPNRLQTIVVTASVPGIDCGDSRMNKYLRAALKAEDFPEVRYQALQYRLIDNSTAVQTSGELTIAGVTRDVFAGARLIPLPQGGTRVLGAMEINMRDFGVKPPSLFFGALKVADMVTVKIDTVVQLPPGLTDSLFAVK